jgi:hypothetical protein
MKTKAYTIIKTTDHRGDKMYRITFHTGKMAGRFGEAWLKRELIEWAAYWGY